MRVYTIYPKRPKRLFRYYRTVSLTVSNSTAIFCDFLIFFLTGRKKIRVGTKIVGRVGLPEPHKFLFWPDGNMWPSKISNGPPKKSEGGQTWPSKLLTWGQHSYTEPSPKDVLPSKIRSLYKKMGPPISMMGPPSYSKLSPKDPQTFNLM